MPEVGIEAEPATDETGPAKETTRIPSKTEVAIRRVT
jgi:hypothetical protein